MLFHHPYKLEVVTKLSDQSLSNDFSFRLFSSSHFSRSSFARAMASLSLLFSSSISATKCSCSLFSSILFIILVGCCVKRWWSMRKNLQNDMSITSNRQGKKLKILCYFSILRRRTTLKYLYFVSQGE